MTRKNTKHTRGFTLIEMLMYIGLFGIVMTGAIVGMYGFLESAGRNETRAVMEEEGNFLLGKIRWAVSQANAIEEPFADASGTALLLGTSDSADDPIRFEGTGSDISMSRAGAGADILNSSNVSIADLSFTHTYDTGPYEIPESVEVAFIISARTPDGQTLSEEFSGTEYLRK
jgi:prepilin-type N-terminal cleavage/methylation domain-containing protein